MNGAAFLFLWLAGVFLVLLWFFLCSLTLWHQVKIGAQPPDERVLSAYRQCAALLGLRRTPRILLQGAVNTPSLCLLPSPVILLEKSIGGRNDAELRHVLLHELCHYRRRDHLQNVLLIVLQALCWPAPFLWLCFSKWRKRIDFANERVTLHYIPEAERREYVLALLAFSDGVRDGFTKPSNEADRRKDPERRIAALCGAFPHRKGDASMNRYVHLKSALRRPVRTALLVLLIAALSFAFVSRAAEYIVVNREIEAIGGYYRSIGTLNNLNEDADYYDVAAAAELISGSEWIAFEDRSRAASGVMDDIYNADTDGMTNSGMPFFSQADVWLTGTLEKLSAEPSGSVLLQVAVDTVVAGYPEFAEAGRKVRVFYEPGAPQEDDSALNTLQEGSRILLRARYDPKLSSRHSTRSSSAAGDSLLLLPLDSADRWFAPLAEGEAFDFGARENEAVKANLDQLEQNIHALHLTGTADMSAMPDTQPVSRLMYLTEGRWLDRNDHVNQNRVCVVHADFAEMRGLKVGDTLTMTVRDFGDTDHLLFGYLNDSQSDWKEYPTVRETYEIVGLYNLFSPNKNTSFTTYMRQFAYVPLSTLPESYGRPFGLFNSYSFTLNTPRDEAAFIVEFRDRLADMGYELSFVGNNAANFWSTADPIRQSTRFNLIIFSAAAFLGMLLAAFLGLGQGRKEYAILRALGAKKRSASRSLLLPPMLIGGLGVLGGALPAWSVALAKTTDTLLAVTLPNGAETNAALSPLWLGLFCGGLFVLLALMLFAGTLWLSRKPVIGLLQGMTAFTAGATETAPYCAARAFDSPSLRQAAFHPDSARKTRRFAVSARFVLRHIFRAPVKSLLCIATATVFLLALGWMKRTVGSSEAEVNRLYNTVTVDLDIAQKGLGFTDAGAGIIHASVVDGIRSSDFVGSAYTEAFMRLDTVTPADTEQSAFLVDVSAAEELGAFFAAHQVENPDIEYAAGWNERRYHENAATGSPWPVILSEAFAAELGVTPGDSLRFTYTRDFGKQKFREASGELVVAGLFRAENALNVPPVLMPLSAMRSLHEAAGLDLYYATAHFTLDPARNRELDSFRTLVGDLLNESGAGLLPLRAVFWDEELRLAVEPLEQTIRLLTVLFPVTTAASVLIAAGLSVLLLLLTVKEAAFLRVLGATKRRVRLMLSAWQTALCMAGLLAGLLGLAAARGSPGASYSGALLVCAALYLIGTITGAVFTAVMITRRKPMELLQVKE